MNKKDSSPFEIAIGVGLVVAATAVFLVASLARTTSSAPPTPTPSPTPMPALSQRSAGAVEGPTATPAALSTPTAIPALSSASPLTETPASIAIVPETAPDFTLPRAGGGTFTLTEQLAQRPLVLVFFQKGG